MDPVDRFCLLSYDEMQISEQLDFDKNVGKFIGYATLGNNLNSLGEKIYVIMLRGLKKTEFIRKAKLYTNGANQGGLKDPCLEILSLVCHCEYYFKAHKNFILRNENTELIQRLIEDIQILFPDCCNVKQKIVKHFFTVRSYCKEFFRKHQ